MSTPLEITGLVVGLLLTLVGFLLNRSLQQIDEMLKSLLNDVKQMQLKLVSISQSYAFMEHRVEKLERDCSALYRSFRSIDRIVAQRLGVTIPPPDTDSEPETAA